MKVPSAYIDKVIKKFESVNSCTGIFLFIATLLFTTPANSAASGPKLNLEARLNVGTRLVQGSCTFEITNHAKIALNAVPVITYPNIFKKPPVNLNDVNYEWFYPKEFNPGSITIELEPGSLDRLLAESETITYLKLAKPWLPGRTLRFTLRFTTLVPHKFGNFGVYSDMLTLAGGWHPTIPALSADGKWQLMAQPDPQQSITAKIHYRGHLLLNQQHFFSESPAVAQMEFKNTPMLSLVQSPDFRVMEIATPNRCSATFYLRGNRRSGREAALRQSLTTLLTNMPALADSSHCRFTLIEAPLRTELAAQGGGSAIMISDRLYKLFPALRRYHKLPVAQALFMNSQRQWVERFERGGDRLWVAEALAWWHTEALAQKIFQGERDARQLPIIRALSFLPSVDEVIYTPQFPFTSSYYNINAAQDIQHLDVRHFNRLTPNGHFIFAKLLATYGQAAVDRLFNDYQKDSSSASLRQLSARTLPAPKSDDFYQQWLHRPPAVNYRIKSIDRTLANGKIDYHIVFQRHGTIAVPEPVIIEVNDHDDNRQQFVWDGKSAEFAIAVKTRSYITYVQIDPAGRTTEIDKGDNRYPTKYKFVLTAFLFDFDFNDFNPNLLIATQWRKVYPDQNRYNLSYSYSSTTGGSFSLGYTRLFGKIIDELRLSHGMSLTYAVSSLDESFLSQGDSVTSISPSGTTTELVLSYGFGDRLAFFNPKQGIVGGTYFDAGLKALGGDFDFYKTAVGFTGIVPIHPQHFLVTNFGMGISGGSDIPTQKQFILGGISNLRGFSSSDARLVGRNHLLVSGEYRHTLLNDLDMNFFEILRLRKLQGVIFSDAGNVTQSVAESLTAADSDDSVDLDGLFDLSDMFIDAGYGLRLYYDAFGVRNTLLRFDIANAITPNENGFDPFYYISFSQAF